jgi:hypothetical protein
MPRVGPMRVGNPPISIPLWSKDAYYWRFTDDAISMPPRVEFVRGQFDCHWSVVINGIYHELDEGDVILYGPDRRPRQVIRWSEARYLFPDDEQSATA